MPIKQNKLRTIPDEMILKWVLKSKTIKDLLKNLGFDDGGNHYRIIKEKLKELNADTSHFQKTNAGITFIITPIEDYFNGKKKIKSDQFKKRLFNEGYKEKKCEICDNDTWMDKPIPLQLHHINGDRYDNSLENIQIICPNCHAQTDNFCSKNLHTYNEKEMEKKREQNEYRKKAMAASRLP